MVEPVSPGAPPAVPAPRFEHEVEVLRFVVETSGDGFAVADADGRIVYANDAAEAIPGRGALLSGKEGPPAGQRCFRQDGVTPISPAELPLARALRGENSESVEIRIRRDGERLDAVIEARARPIRNADGAVAGAAVAFREVTGLRMSVETSRTLAVALERTVDSVFITDRAGAIRYVNPAFERLTGYSRDEVLGSTPSILESGHHDREFFRVMWETILAGEEYGGLIRNRRKDGSRFWSEQTITPVPDTTGAVSGFVSLLRDVDEREIALRRERDFNAAVLSSTTAPVFVTDAEGRVVRFNPACERVCGFDREEVTGFRIDQLPMVVVDRSRWGSCFRRSLDAEHAIACELPWSTRDGRTAVVRWTFHAIRDDSGNATNVVATGVDVTETRIARDALAAGRLRYRQVVESLHEGLWLVDQEGLTTFVNERMAEMLGYRVETMIGRPMTDFTDAAGAEVLERGFARRRAGVTEDHEIELRRRDGRRLAAIVQASPIFDRGGRYCGMLAGVLDITERIRHEERIRAARDELEDRVEERTAELRRALEEVRRLKARLEAENVYLREEVRRSRPETEIVGTSPAIRDAVRRLERVAPTGSTVLLLGETGTGKGLFAQVLHGRSVLSDRPLVTVDCAALPETLIESELFGHERGAFTGAVRCRPGRFEVADGGTVFLDEIGDLPRPLQAKLLRFLQSGEFERVGSDETRRVTVRVIAATNRNLRTMVEHGQFRSDLYYRLSVFPIRVPPLRERLEDIPALVRHVLHRRGGTLGRPVPEVSEKVLEALGRHSWPGNVRELENTVERALITATGGRLTLDDVLASIDDPLSRPGRGDEGRTLAERDRSYILRVLTRCGWRIKGRGNAADVLGLAPSTLRDRMRRLRIERPPDDSSDRTT